MISIDSKTQEVLNSAKLNKLSKKGKDKKTKFTTKTKSQPSNPGESLNKVTDISNMLFLQEIDQYRENTHDFAEASKKAFKVLKELQINLLNEIMHSHQMKNLKNALNNNQFITNNPELTAISEDIKLRIEVEIAKLETTS